jgi:hypothetical protein
MTSAVARKIMRFKLRVFVTIKYVGLPKGKALSLLFQTKKSFLCLNQVLFMRECKVFEKTFQENSVEVLEECLFACPKLRLIDDLSDITDFDDLIQTPYLKLLECRISGTKITETADHTKPDTEVNASTTIQVQTECVHDARAMETVLEPWRSMQKFDMYAKKHMNRLKAAKASRLHYRTTKYITIIVFCRWW